MDIQIFNVCNRLIFHEQNIFASYELLTNEIITYVLKSILTITYEHTLSQAHLKLWSFICGKMNKLLTPKYSQLAIWNILIGPNPLWNTPSNGLVKNSAHEQPKLKLHPRKSLISMTMMSNISSSRQSSFSSFQQTHSTVARREIRSYTMLLSINIKWYGILSTITIADTRCILSYLLSTNVKSAWNSLEPDLSVLFGKILKPS